MVDEKGYIYVFIVVVEENDRRKMDIFSPKGKYLYRLGLAFPGGCRFKSKNIVIKGSHLFVVQECKKGSFKLVKYKINRVF